MAEVMFEIQDAEIRSPTERVQQAAIVEFAAQLRQAPWPGSKPLGNRSEGSQAALPQPTPVGPMRAAAAAGHGHALDAISIPLPARSRQYRIASRVEFRWWLACGPACSPPLRQRCRFSESNAAARIVRASPGKPQDIHGSPLILSQTVGYELYFYAEQFKRSVEARPGQNKLLTRSLLSGGARVSTRMECEFYFFPLR